MKKSLTILSFVLLASVVFAQKPKKTYDYEVFAREVIKSLTFGVDRFYPNDYDLQAISKTSGKSMDQLREERDACKRTINPDISNFVALKTPVNPISFELNIHEESPFKKADITIFSEWQGKKLSLH